MSRLAWGMSALFTVILLPVAVAGAGLAFLDPNDWKPEIVRAVSDATGRTITLNGPLRVSWSLWPTFEITDVSLANLPGGTRPDIARAERIEAQLSIPALFRRRVEVVKLTLTGPNILFEQVGARPNWIANAPPDVASDTPPKSAAESGFMPTFALHIRTIQIRNGMVTWKFPQRTKVVGIRSLQLQHPVDGGPVELAATLVYSDYQPFSLRVSARPTGAVSDPWRTNIDFAAFDTTASATGTADLNGSFDLQVEAKAGALEKLNALLPEMRLPAMHDATLSTHLLNGPALGALPVIGATRLSFASADLGDPIKDLTLGATELSLADAGGAAKLSALGRYTGQSFRLEGSVGVPLQLDGQVSVPVDLQANAVAGSGNDATGGEGSLALKGNVALTALRFGGLDVTARSRTPSLAALRPLLSPSLPALTDVRFDGRVIVPADAGSVAFKNAKLLTREGDVTGDWTFGLQSGLMMHGKLVSPRLDMDLMLAAFGVELPAAPAFGGNTGPVISTSPLPWALLRGPVVKLSTKIEAMTFQGQVWSNVNFVLDLSNGRLQISPLTLSLPDGQLRMSMSADASRDTVPVTLEMHAPGIPLALVARYTGLPGPMVGAVRIDALLHGTGGTPHDLAASLNGTVSAVLVGGRMTNAAFIMLTSASLEALGINVPAQGETDLRCLGLIASFTKGVGVLRTIALDTTYLQVDGNGQVDFAQETVALKLRPLAQISGSAIAVPVVVEGPFRAVKGRLDADGIDKLGLFIDSLFGSDRSTACIDAGFVPVETPGGKPGEGSDSGGR